MSDRIGVMSEGKLLQVGDSKDIYENPKSRFVADFIGDINLVSATANGTGSAVLPNGAQVAVVNGPSNGEVTLALRPERLTLHHGGDQVPDGRNRLRARIARRTYFGDVYFYEVDAGLDHPIEVKEENRPDLQIHEVGDEVVVSWHPEGANLVTD